MLDLIFPDYPRFYVLNADNTPRRVFSIREHVEWWAENEALFRVAWTEVDNRFDVSTIFLGMDFNTDTSAEPVLWETMIFARTQRRVPVGDMYRYTSYEKALKGHVRACAVASAIARELDAKQGMKN